ncbi:MarR family winged helix-turn-helix transcriptional regulator [Cupriavidus nantongensis]|uniref:MarR family transcriptional regulator n=1 Tax=Cupriavidus nantongensis TaxID=1796606 RepID=A0A142JT00_9BURK|nr:MarR family transcriptional regulator [Cupriavidus nantongensis]AMR81212.1 MarR family transcriptional regulator [Cupriavidus nantongensis]
MARENIGNDSNRLQRPRRLADFINYRVYHLNRVALGAAALHLRARAGVTRREWRMISFLGEQPGTRLTELAQSAGLDKVLASRAVHALVVRGLVRREIRSHDRRAAAFTLTEEGEAVYRTAFAQARAFNTQLAACLTAEEARVLSRCLDKLQAQAGAMLAEAQALPQPAGEAPAWELQRVWRGEKG